MLKPRCSRLWRKRGKNGNVHISGWRVKSHQPELGISCVVLVESPGTIMALGVTNREENQRIGSHAGKKGGSGRSTKRERAIMNRLDVPLMIVFSVSQRNERSARARLSNDRTGKGKKYTCVYTTDYRECGENTVTDFQR